MRHLVFVYGTLLRDEVNHGLLREAEFVGAHRTEPRFTLVRLGAYPGLLPAGRTAVAGELYRVDNAGLKALDRLEDYPRLYDRRLLATRFGPAWVYLYRGSARDRQPIPSGDWRAVSRAATPLRAAAVRGQRDSKNPGRRQRIRSRLKATETSMTTETPASQTTEEGRFTIQLEQREGYAINVAFDWPRAADLLMDEPPPLGETNGPNASRLLAAAVGNCLSASLLYCLGKEEPPDRSLRTEVTCVMVRNEKKRLRIGRMEVRLILAPNLIEGKRFERCKTLFEDFCVVSASVRQGIPMVISVLDEAGHLLHQSD
ncbi:MAG: gamma-glutamylcyclotransferase [Halochromatium sp.]|uniref:gamma-glutamylcyclotransferase n=1 Tax=Halochromatium sp. TaxID=2049430 RepID=UPI0039791AED